MAQIILPGDAGYSDVLAGKHFSAGTIFNDLGTMPNKTGAGIILTPSGSDQAIPKGYYPGGLGDGKVAAVNVPVANVLTGTTIAGQQGTMPNNGAIVITPGTSNQIIAAGYHNGSGYVKGDANLVSGNIKSGVSIFSVAGNVLAEVHGSQVYNTAGNYSFTVPNYVSQITILANGAGGSGGAGNNGGGYVATSGSNGGLSVKTFAVIPGNSYTIIVGAGGAGSTPNSFSSGNLGGNTTVTGPNCNIIANGGNRGYGNVGTNIMNGQSGGSASGGDYNCIGGPSDAICDYSNRIGIHPGTLFETNGVGSSSSDYGGSAKGGDGIVLIIW